MSVAAGHCTLPRAVIKSHFKTDGKYRYIASLNVKWDPGLINRTFYTNVVSKILIILYGREIVQIRYDMRRSYTFCP